MRRRETILMIAFKSAKIVLINRVKFSFNGWFLHTPLNATIFIFLSTNNIAQVAFI